MTMVGSRPEGALLADAGDLPLEDESVDGAFCSNLLEHTPDPEAVIREIERVLRPGGWGYISWTNWYSPWGGHDMTPYQYLGPRLGPRLYERRHGPPRKNPYGAGLWAVHVGPTIRRALSPTTGNRADRAALLAPAQRHLPVPLLREVLTWNCVIRVRKLALSRSASKPAAARHTASTAT